MVDMMIADLFQHTFGEVECATLDALFHALQLAGTVFCHDRTFGGVR